MASVTSHTSPYDFDSSGETDESWQYIDYSSGTSAPGSVGFLSSPASGSLNGYAIIGHVSTPSHLSLSPAMTDSEQPFFLPPATSNPMGNDLNTARFTSNAPTNEFSPSASAPFAAPAQGYLFANDVLPEWQPDAASLTPGGELYSMDYMPPSEQQLEASPEISLEEFQQFQLEGTFGQLDQNVEHPHDSYNAQYNIISSPSQGSISSASPKSSSPKSETGGKPSPIVIRKVKPGKVEKSKTNQSGKFHIVTPVSISASAGRPNPYECFEAMRTTQRGRKGPLANTVKEDALQVRRRGACFCCRSRKVKCDTERPCKHCQKLILQVPQVVCWQFQDFLTNLFPDFIRTHLKREEMAKFLRENVDGFTIDGVEKTCRVRLFSGVRFATTLDIDAKFFTAKTCDVLQHWHLSSQTEKVDLNSNGSAPIGLDATGGAQREELRKKVKTYVRQLIDEPAYAEQVTDSLRWTQLPTKILGIVQRYAKKADSHMVKKALSIYAMQYVMTRHLCLTKDTIVALQPTGLVPQNSQWVTSRVLARQVKSLVDELCMREMSQLFELFTKALKPKYRKEWAPSLAAFLVLCLFMEAVETTTDNFVISENKVHARNNYEPAFRSSFALDMCRELENMPFKQFAYQFHNIYQTHCKDANVKPFNPLFDDAFAEHGELDETAIEMVEALRELFHGDEWQDMQFLAEDDFLLNQSTDPAKIDTSGLYTGRLVSKFLLSFMDETRIFGGPI